MFADCLRLKLAGAVELTAEQISILEAHYELLGRWNRILNLTRIDSMEAGIERHYAESLFLGAHLPRRPLLVVDVGSGAGFPGIPVAVLRPDCSVTLVESHRRKAVFLREATRRLSNVVVRAERAEDLRERFDCAVSRAVSYGDLVPALRKLADAAELLTGIEPPPAALGFRWSPPIRLPWGKNRFLRISDPAPLGSVCFT